MDRRLRGQVGLVLHPNFMEELLYPDGWGSLSQGRGGGRGWKPRNCRHAGLRVCSDENVAGVSRPGNPGVDPQEGPLPAVLGLRASWPRACTGGGHVDSKGADDPPLSLAPVPCAACPPVEGPALTSAVACR